MSAKIEGEDQSASAASGEQTSAKPPRRVFLNTTANVAMATGLIAGYGSFGVMAARYLYPAGPMPRAWMYVKDLKSFLPGESLPFRTPAGASVVIARKGDTGTVDDFFALSSTCPHLGCKVSWEGPKNRFFCPCHNGVFDPSGKAVEGPPAAAGQSLSRYPLKIEEGLLFIEVPVETVG